MWNIKDNSSFSDEIFKKISDEMISNPTNSIFFSEIFLTVNLLFTRLFLTLIAHTRPLSEVRGKWKLPKN